MRVPLVDLQKQHASIRDEVMAAAGRIIDAQTFILGPEVAAFELEIATRLNVARAVGVACGSDALLLALTAAGVRRGDEVVTTPFSFIATAEAIARAGGIPVFADIEEDGFNVDPEKTSERLTPRTRAVVPVHLYGQCARMEELIEAVQGRGVAVVEDAAQAFDAGRGAKVPGTLEPAGNVAGTLDRGEKVPGTLDHVTLPKVAGTFGERGEVAATSNARAKVAGTFGDFGCFSFFPSKNLGAWGDGGMVVTREPDHGTRIAQLRAHGGLVPYVSNETGLNSRLDALHAAVLRVKLRHLSAWTAGRRAAAAYYRELFASFRLLDVVKPPLDAADEFHVYNQFTIRCIRRDALADHLKAEGIGVAVYYPLPLHLQPCFAGLGYKQGDFPRAERACQEVLSLPMHPFLCRDEQEYVVEKIASFYRGAR